MHGCLYTREPAKRLSHAYVRLIPQAKSQEQNQEGHSHNCKRHEVAGLQECAAAQDILQGDAAKSVPHKYCQERRSGICGRQR